MDPMTSSIAQQSSQSSSLLIGNDIWIMILTSIVGTIITILTIVIGNNVLRKNAKDQIKYDAITKQRINWLETIRTELSDYISLTRIFYLKKILNLSNALQGNSKKEDADELYDFLNQIITLSVRIRLRLNPIEDKQLIDCIRELEVKARTDFNFSSDELNFKTEEIVTLAKNMLKNEWQKVKNEAKNLKYTI